MSFADNLRGVRKERAVSQEALAELLNVSRQAVSKWEQDLGYPEMETMISLARELKVSLDYLLFGQNTAAVQPPKRVVKPRGEIAIKSQDGKSVINCIKVLSFPVSAHMPSSKSGEPLYVLYGIDSKTFWGDSRTLLGWYADEESIVAEEREIISALDSGKTSYQLEYAAKVKMSLFSVKICE